MVTGATNVVCCEQSFLSPATRQYLHYNIKYANNYDGTSATASLVTVDEFLLKSHKYQVHKTAWVLG